MPSNCGVGFAAATWASGRYDRVMASIATRRVDVLIVGSGFAGAALAFHLSREHDGRIVIVEQEKIPGAHASGRNASLLLSSVGCPAVRRVAEGSRAAFRRHREAVGFQEVGSVLLGTEDQIAAVCEPDLIPTERWTRDEVVRRVPVVEGHDFAAALSTPGDGAVDTWALLNFYLDGARSRGVEIVYDCAVRGVEAGPPCRARTSRGDFEARCLVNAAGAWAEDFGRLAGAEPPALVPVKRHLFILDGVEPTDESWPFVWNLEHGFYFRPESGGLLFSICDEERSSSLDETVSPGISEALAEKVSAHLPRFEEARIRKVWSCFRTHADDGRFVLGWDPDLENLFWVAGLGGHGMGCSWEIGRLAAESFLGRGTDPAFDPARFAAAEA